MARGRAQEGLADRHARLARRSGRQHVARHDVPGRHAEVRSEDRKVHLFQPAARHEQGHDPGQHGAGRILARGRQGLVAEQRLCGRASARSRERQHRDLHAVQGLEAGREPQHLRRHPGLAEQSSTSPTSLSEHIGRIDAKTGEIKLFEMPTKAFGATPRHDGRAGPSLVRRVPRQQNRDVRHQDRKVPGMGDAHALVVAL